jgi:hypothetical protein
LWCIVISNAHRIARHEKQHPGVISTQINRDIARMGGDGMGAGMARVRLIDYKPPLREIQNYTNGGKTRENIPFEIKKIIDSREWIPKEWKENPGKYSVQNQKFQI